MANPIFGKGEKFFNQPQLAYAGAPAGHAPQARPDFQPAPGPSYQDGVNYRQAPGQQAFPQQFAPAQEPFSANQPRADWRAPNESFTPQSAGQSGVMTYESVLTKTAISLFGVFAAAAISYLLVPLNWIAPVWIGAGLASLVTVLIVSLRKVVSPVGLGVYALFEGLFLGALSKFFDALYPGILGPAVLATFVVAGVTLAAVHFGGVRTSPRMRRMVIIGTIAFAVIMLINFVLALFGVQTGLRTIGSEAGGLAYLASAIAIFLAVFNLVMDFEAVEVGVENGAPDSESWRAALGITVTMVWLYVEILRILSYFRD